MDTTRTPDDTITTPVCIEPGPHRAHTMHVYTDGGRRLIGTKQCPGRYTAPRHLATNLGRCGHVTNGRCSRPATQTVLPYVAIYSTGTINAGSVLMCDEHAADRSQRPISRSVYWHVPTWAPGRTLQLQVPSGARHRVDDDPVPAGLIERTIDALLGA